MPFAILTLILMLALNIHYSIKYFPYDFGFNVETFAYITFFSWNFTTIFAIFFIFLILSSGSKLARRALERKR